MTTAWGGMQRHGLDELSPPEVERVLLELPTDRAEYVGLVRDISGWPERSVVGRRIPTEAEIARLNREAGRFRAVALLEDERAIEVAAPVFDRVFVLDPLYDTGDLLYAAWHDTAIRDEHTRHLAQHARRLAQLAPLLSNGTAVLAPDHLPGGWDPRPGWRRLRSDADPHTRWAWSLRQALVLLYWADRLNAVICTSLTGATQFLGRTCAEPLPRSHRLARRAPNSYEWKVRTGKAELPEPALLLKRALDGRDLDAQPSLPRTRLRREPLCLLVAPASTA
jgi:hypothetical protein